MHPSANKGRQAEELALHYLQQHKLRLICRNFHSRFGEIDLIMQDHDTLIFIEVKQRDSGINDAIESISWAKQQKLIKSAQYYLLRHGNNIFCRFDAIVIDKQLQIEWLRNIITL